MADIQGTEDESERGAYELQIYALSPVAPSPSRLVAEAEGGGLPIRIAASDAAGPDDEGWSRLVLTSREGTQLGVVLSAPDALEAQLAALAEDRDAGEDVPAELFEAKRLYLLELPQGAEDADEEDLQAVFVLAAWALATLTEGLVFDPQEEFFADADSFLALAMDEEAAEASDTAGH